MLAFGFANTCYDYAALKRLIYDGPSPWGRLLQSYIGDLWWREHCVPLARWRLLGFVLLASAIGLRAQHRQVHAAPGAARALAGLRGRLGGLRLCRPS